MVDLDLVKTYFKDRFLTHGASPSGVDWNSIEAQSIRFEQLSKLIDFKLPFSIIDYGCGYCSLIDFLIKKEGTFSYQGFDIVEEMILHNQEKYSKNVEYQFTNDEKSLNQADFVVESGIFNVKQSVNYENWTAYVLEILEKMNNLAYKGLAFNFLTSYSDPEFMRPDLYYADPCFFFDYAKKNFSKNVALLHDYMLYDFTIIVKK